MTIMKAIELANYGGFESLTLIDTEQPKPTANQILIQVRAAGINFAELELTKGDYRVPKTPPFIMGFEAAGVVVEVGSQVQHVKFGDRITSIVTSGGYAEYATADANAAIPIPAGVSFAQATAIPVQGISAYSIKTTALAAVCCEPLKIGAGNTVRNSCLWNITLRTHVPVRSTSVVWATA